MSLQLVFSKAKKGKVCRPKWYAEDSLKLGNPYFDDRPSKTSVSGAVTDENLRWSLKMYIQSNT